MSEIYTYSMKLLLIAILITALIIPQTVAAALQQPVNCTDDTDKRPNTTEYLTHFNCGHVVGDTREFTLIAEENQIIPISNQGHEFNAWTFNNTIPGPTLRMTEGDHVKITVINSANSTLPHSLHMHSIHNGFTDGITGKGGSIVPGASFTYEFIAQPAGVYPYHCHVEPVADHINRGLYGMMIIDPKEPREEMTEFAMLMNGYDMHYEQEGPILIAEFDKNDPTQVKRDEGKEESEEEGERDNEIYTVNGKAFDYTGNNKIELKQGEKYRIYLVNMLEFDLINTFHIHGMMFKYIPSGTEGSATFVNDIVTMAQGDRGILEFVPEYEGEFMFHAHQAEFSSLGWMSFFNVVGENNSTSINNYDNGEELERFVEDHNH